MRLRTLAIGLPATVIAISFAIANRHGVVFSLDPFSQEAPALALTVPLYLLLFFVFLIGTLVGGASSWVGQGRHRKKVRQEKRKVKNLERDLATQEAVTAQDTPDQAIEGPEASKK